MHGDYVELPFAFHPGETLEEKLQEMGMSVSELSTRTGFSVEELSRVIACKATISRSLAEALEMVTKIPTYFWLTKQEHYDSFTAKNSSRKVQRVSTRPIIVSSMKTHSKDVASI